MAKLAYIGYQLYALPEGLFAIGSSTMNLLNKKSKEDLEDILNVYLRDADENDIYLDHKINRGLL